MIIKVKNTENETKGSFKESKIKITISTNTSFVIFSVLKIEFIEPAILLVMFLISIDGLLFM